MIAEAFESRAIVLDEILPHAPATVWKALTSGELIGRWLMMPTGFAAIPGTHFSFQTSPAGKWDGTIRCEVLEAVPNQRLSYSWRGGDAGNAGYGSPLDTVVTFTLAAAEAGTRLTLEHAGFRLPVNEHAYRVMNEGWQTVTQRLFTVAGELEDGE